MKTAIILLLCLAIDVSAYRAVLVRWLPVPEPDVTGYRLRIGKAPRTYGQLWSVGVTQALVLLPGYTLADIGSTWGTLVPTNTPVFQSPTNLGAGSVYYFAVTALNQGGAESDLSAEASVTNSPAAPGGIIIDVKIGGQYAQLGFPDLPQVFAVESSGNLAAWEELLFCALSDPLRRPHSMTLGFEASEPSRFYRLREVVP